MKICIDINTTLKSTIAGLGRFTVTLTQGLISESPDTELVLYYKKGLFEFKKRPPKFKGGKITYVNGYKNKSIAADICVSSSYDFNPPENSKYALIVHDLIPLAAEQFSSRDAKKRLLDQLPKRLAQADCVVCISKTTQYDLERFYPWVKGKSTVIYNGVDESFTRINNKAEVKSVLKKLGIDGEYLLFVSAAEPRKNLISLLRAFSIVKRDFPDLKLVLTGKKVDSYGEIEKFMKTCGHNRDIKYLGYVNQDDLAYLYNGAQAFVYPSYYEGFGLPIVEAFACGTAVVTSNVSSMKEIGEGSAELVDPYNAEDVASGVKRVLSDRDYRNRLIDQGLKKSRLLSAREMARQYSELLGAMGGRSAQNGGREKH